MAIMMIIMVLFMENSIIGAVMGINTVESATPTTEEILGKKLATGWHVPSDENGRH
jgi:hypothetical protein